MSYPLSRKDAEIVMITLGYTARACGEALDRAYRSGRASARYHRLTWDLGGFRVYSTIGGEASAALRLILAVAGLSYAEAITAVRDPGNRTGLPEAEALDWLAGLGYNPSLCRWAVAAGITAPDHVIFLDRHRIHHDDGIYDVYGRDDRTDAAILTAREAARPPEDKARPADHGLTEDEAHDVLAGLGYGKASGKTRALRQAREDGPAVLGGHLVTWSGGGYCVTRLVTSRDKAPDGWPNLSRDRDVTEILAAMRVVDDWLDGAAPAVYRQDPAAPAELNEARALANMWRRVAAGPASEGGEAIDALNGMTGGNPRKGVTHTRDDLLAELADGAVANLLAVQSFTKDTAATWAVFLAALAKALSRVPRDQPAPGTSAEETSRGCPAC